MELPEALSRLASTRRPMLWGFGFFLVLGTLGFLVQGSGGAGVQPIAFNHAKHVQSGMTCTDCHTGAESQANATLPTLATCLMCHETAVTKSAEEEKIRRFASRSQELAWKPLPRLPAHVYFSHRRHVQAGKMACRTCHGPMESATAPPTRLFRPLDMAACIECHQKNRAGTDCNDCHR